MSIVNALKKLVVALGGAEDVTGVPGDNIAEVINQITERVAQLDFTDNELPSVSTPADIGKILTVDAEGKWVAANPPTELPSVAAPADVGKILKVDSEGAWGAATP